MKVPRIKAARKPKCSKCFFHKQQDIPIKGHKRKCPFKGCKCEWCGLLEERQHVSIKDCT